MIAESAELEKDWEKITFTVKLVMYVWQLG